MKLDDLSKEYKYVIYLKFTYNSYVYNTTTTITSGIIILLNFHEKENEINFLVLYKNNIGIHKKFSHKVINYILKKSNNTSLEFKCFLYSILSIKDEDIPITILWKEKR